MHGPICTLHALEQQIRECLVVQLVTGRDPGEHEIDNRLDRQTTGILPVSVATHAIGYDKQAELLGLCIIGSCPLHGKEAIFVRLVLAFDTWIREMTYSQAQVVTLKPLNAIGYSFLKIR